MSSHNSQDSHSGHWQKQLASLIDHVRLKSFPSALENFLASQCHFDSVLMLTFKKSLKPVVIHPTNPAEHSPTLRSYLKTAYILDPLCYSIFQGTIPNISRLTDIAPDSFETTEYYQTCYKDFDFVDEINIIIPLDNDVTLAITIGRQSRLGTITRAELKRLHDMYPIINSLVRQFWLSQSQEFVKYETDEGAMTHALSTFASGVLTKREQEITALILQGHSSKAIANQLNISLGTVKVHRKNIHTRLNTSTQSEIFTLFLTHLNELENAVSASSKEST